MPFGGGIYGGGWTILAVVEKAVGVVEDIENRNGEENPSEGGSEAYHWRSH